MRIVLADLKGGDGFISKDTVAGGYGSRLAAVFESHVDRRRDQARGSTTCPAFTWPTPRRSRRARATRSWRRAANWSTATWRSCCRRSSTYRRETAWARQMRARGVARRFHRPRGVEAAAALRGRRRLHRQRRARSGADAAGRRRDARRHRRRARRSTISTRCRFRCGISWSARSGDSACRSPAGRSAARCRCSPAAAVRSSAPTVRTGSSPTYRTRSVGNILDELSYLARYARAAAHRVSRSALHAGPRPRARAVRRASSAAG